MNDSSKATNSQIVRNLITIVQAHYDSDHQKLDPGAQYNVTVDADNLVQNINLLLHLHRRQQDRLADMMDGMQKIVKGG